MSEPNHAIAFVSLGMLVLDELHFSFEKSLKDVLGGSGTFSVLGARLFQPRPSSTSIGWRVRAGTDLPSSVRAKLESWGTTLYLQVEPHRRTTRGYLEYVDESNGKKDFRYLTPILENRPRQLNGTPLLGSQSFHFLSDPSEVIEQVADLLDLRQKADISHKPLIIWEPRPSSCNPDNLIDFYKAVRVVDVFSPNHVEIATIFGEAVSPDLDKALLEELASRFLGSGIGEMASGVIAIRAGEHGCLIESYKQAATWLPAYYQPSDTETQEDTTSAKMIDPTGAGNAFLGAFAIGFLSTRNMYQAACYGTVGSSFAIEQIGVPYLDATDNGKELWNGSDPFERLQEYMSRTRNAASELSRLE